MGRIVVEFKSVEELPDGTEAGKVFVYDDDTQIGASKKSSG